MGQEGASLHTANVAKEKQGRGSLHISVAPSRDLYKLLPETFQVERVLDMMQNTLEHAEQAFKRTLVRVTIRQCALSAPMGVDPRAKGKGKG